MTHCAASQNEGTSTRWRCGGTICKQELNTYGHRLTSVPDSLGAEAYSWLPLPCLEADTIRRYSRGYSRGFLCVCHALASRHDHTETSALLCSVSLLRADSGELEEL